MVSVECAGAERVAFVAQEGSKPLTRSDGRLNGRDARLIQHPEEVMYAVDERRGLDEGRKQSVVLSGSEILELVERVSCPPSNVFVWIEEELGEELLEALPSICVGGVADATCAVPMRTGDAECVTTISASS